MLHNVVRYGISRQLADGEYFNLNAFFLPCLWFWFLTAGFENICQLECLFFNLRIWSLFCMLDLTLYFGSSAFFSNVNILIVIILFLMILNHFYDRFNLRPFIYFLIIYSNPYNYITSKSDLFFLWNCLSFPILIIRLSSSPKLKLVIHKSYFHYIQLQISAFSWAMLFSYFYHLKI